MQRAGTVGRKVGHVSKVRYGGTPGSGDETPRVCSSYGTTLPAFRNDFADSSDLASGVCVRFDGFSDASTITAHPANAPTCGVLDVVWDGTGLHRRSCDGRSIQ